jgi:hypothetical protein
MSKTVSFWEAAKITKRSNERAVEKRDLMLFQGRVGTPFKEQPNTSRVQQTLHQRRATLTLGNKKT